MTTTGSSCFNSTSSRVVSAATNVLSASGGEAALCKYRTNREVVVSQVDSHRGSHGGSQRKLGQVLVINIRQLHSLDRRNQVKRSPTRLQAEVSFRQIGWQLS